MRDPFASIIIPCRNEESFILNCVDSLLSNDYPGDKFEIIIVDGNSSDRTREILSDIIAKRNNVRILSNPGYTFPSGVNIGIDSARGEYLLIAGAHAIYPRGYISACINNSIRYNADNVGGILETIPVNENFIGSLITLALSNPFGVGNSTFRTGSTEITETDTVFGGCYKREVFDKYGVFNEELVSTSDYEFNKRIKRKGARILLIPEIRVNYYTRSSFSKFIRNNFRNGYWAIYPIAVTDHFPVSIRHLVPLAFFLTLILVIALTFVSSQFVWLLAFIIIIYSLLAIVFSLKTGITNLIYLLLLPFVFLFLHLSYGLGSFWGLVNAIKRKWVN